MQVFHDHKADSITIVQDAHRVVGWGLIVPWAVLTGGVGIYASLTDPTGDLVLPVFCAIFAVVILALAAWVLTEIVATFDGKTRTLSLRRVRPWHSRREDIAFDDVFDLETSWLWLPNGDVHHLNLLLAGERRVKLRYDRGDQAEVDRAISEVRVLLRRPRAAAAS